MTFFSFGFIRLGQYAAVDEPLWLYGRISQYWNNIGDGEFHKTDVSDKPGITVSLLSGTALLSYDPDDYDDLRRDGEVFINRNLNMAQFFAAFRFPILLFVSLLLPLLYFLLERALGRGAALLPFALLATSPILIGVTKIINPDALLWLFTTLALVSYLVFQKRAYYRYLFLSGLFLGLALLTKYIANIVFVYLLLLLFVEYLYHPKLTRRAFSDYLKKSLLQIGFVIFVALSTFYIILPANWVDPMELIQGTILSQAFVKVAPLFLGLIFLILLDENLNQSRIIGFALKWLGHFRLTLARIPLFIFFGSLLFVLITTWSGMSVYNFMQLIASPKTISSKSDIFGIFITNFYPLTFGMTPLALFGILTSGLFLLRKRFWQSTSLRFGFYMILFALVYYLGATVNGVASIIRYQIIIFPLVALLGGIGLFHLARFIESKYQLQKDQAVLVFTL
ncbi:MAG: phospholipid carrier-dependent glycosyltransferase, partial [Patescibacteria group bacterium]